MKAKRLLAGLLAALTVASAAFLTGCSGGNSEENAANTTSTRKIVTLNMYVITGDETDPETAKQVQMQINRTLLPEFKTMLKINYITEDEYWNTIDKVTKQVEYYKENGELLVEEELPEEDAAEENAEGTEVAEEPEDNRIVFEDELPAEEEESAEEPVEEEAVEEEVLESDGAIAGTSNLTFNELIDFIFDSDDITLTKPQLDIFIVNDYDRYTELVADEKLAAMDEYLKYDSSVLTKYIYPTFLSAAKVGKSTYGIPTNHALEGDFTYFVYNKDLLDKYGYKVSDLTNYAGLSEYLALIKANEPGVWPVSGTCDISGAEVYDNSFLAIGKQLNALGNSVLPVFMETNYVNHLRAVESYKKNGYFPAQPLENAKYAIEIVKSTELLQHEWNENGTNYAAYLYDLKRVDADEAFTGAMCISSLSTNKDRAMEIITLFNTNPELANLLQYGIEGENYYYDADTESVTMLNDSYTMNTMYTGNTYIKYPLAGNEDYLAKAVATNINTAPSAFLGFAPKFDTIEDKSTYEAVVTICSAAKKAIDEGKLDIDTAVDYAKRELIALGCVYVNTTDLGGIFGKVVATQKAQAAITAESFRLGDEILHYNDYYGLVLEEIEEEVAAETQTDAENADGEVTDGEAAEGEAVDAEQTSDENSDAAAEE